MRRSSEPFFTNSIPFTRLAAPQFSQKFRRTIVKISGKTLTSLDEGFTVKDGWADIEIIQTGKAQSNHIDHQSVPPVSCCKSSWSTMSCRHLPSTTRLLCRQCRFPLVVWSLWRQESRREMSTSPNPPTFLSRYRTVPDRCRGRPTRWSWNTCEISDYVLNLQRALTLRRIHIFPVLWQSWNNDLQTWRGIFRSIYRYRHYYMNI